MSEESDLVWERMCGELRKVRRRRFVAKVGTLAGAGVLGMLLFQRMMVPAEVPGNHVVDVPVEEIQPVEFENESPQLAVLVYDGEGMRFELRGGDQLSMREMEFSLQPVVMGPMGDAW